MALAVALGADAPQRGRDVATRGGEEGEESAANGFFKWGVLVV